MITEQPLLQPSVRLYRPRMQPQVNVTLLNSSQLSPPDDVMEEGGSSCRLCYFSLALVIFCTMYGNLMVCLAVMFDKRLQNITNFFLVSLAITDMGVAILVMPFAIVIAYNNGSSILLKALFVEKILKSCNKHGT